MTTINSMNQLPQSDNANRLEHNELSGLRIPLGKEVQQIALAFASEQANVAKGKQVFLNTLSVIAVHKCLKWFGFESDFGDCWNKARRAIFDVADLLVQDWGRIECFPILPGQTFIDLSDVPPDLIETRQGFVGVKFHQYFNFVEMSGFIHLNKLDKSTLEETLTLDIQQLESFDNIFNYLSYIKESDFRECFTDYFVMPDWFTPLSLGIKPTTIKYSYASYQKNKVLTFCKPIKINEQSDNNQVILVITIKEEEIDKRDVILQMLANDLDKYRQKEIQITIKDNSGTVKSSNLESFATDLIPLRGKRRGYQFKVVIQSELNQIIEKITI